MKKTIFLIPIITLLASCTNNTIKSKPIIVSSFFVITDFVKKIVGEKYDIITLTEDGVEPHEYEPTPGQVKKMYDADIIFCNGLDIEHWSHDLPKELNDKIKFIGEDEKIDYLIIDNAKDPHVWLNPLYALIELDNIKEAMISIDSQNKTYYEERYNIYSSYISNLDSLLENLFSPYENYKFVTSHESFGYFANRYNLQEISINGLSPEDEPTPNKLAELVKEINELNINTIFYESFSSSSISETISKETNTAISTLSTLENVSKDELFNDYNSLILENSLKLLESFKKYGTID